MINFLYQAHSGWRYLLILALVVALVKALAGLLGDGRWSELDRRIGSVTAIVVDIQWLLGMVLWVLQFQRWTAAPGYVGAFEHPVTMTLGLVALHVLWSRAKKAGVDRAKFRLATLAYGVSGLLFALGIWRITVGL